MTRGEARLPCILTAALLTPWRYLRWLATLASIAALIVATDAYFPITIKAGTSVTSLLTLLSTPDGLTIANKADESFVRSMLSTALQPHTLGAYLYTMTLLGAVGHALTPLIRTKAMREDAPIGYTTVPNKEEGMDAAATNPSAALAVWKGLHINELADTCDCETRRRTQLRDYLHMLPRRSQSKAAQHALVIVGDCSIFRQ